MSNPRAFLIALIVPAMIFGAEMAFHSEAGENHGFLLHLLEIATAILAGVGIFLGLLYFRAFKAQELRLGELAEEKKKSEDTASALGAFKLGLDSHAIVAITDPRGNITYVNDLFCEISQYSREELIGQNHRVLNSGHHPKSFFHDMYRHIGKGKPWTQEICNRAKDGTLYWVATTVMPIRDAKGRLKEIVSIRTDITHVKEAEASLRQNNQILSSTFNNFPGGVTVFDQDLTLQIANPAFYRLLDLDEEKFPTGCNFEDILRHNAKTGEYGDGEVEQIVAERLALARQFRQHRMRRKTADGRILEIKGWPLPTGGFISSYLDITDSETMLETLKVKSREAEDTAEKLRVMRDAQSKTHQHLLSSINSMRNGFVIWDKDQRLVLANEAFRQFYHDIAIYLVEGLKFKDFLTIGFQKEVWAETQEMADPEAWVQRQLDLREANKICGGDEEREMCLRDGRELVVSERILDNGDIAVTLIDVTAHRQREKELQDTKELLEKIAYYDQLTDLPNRAHCQTDLDEHFSLSYSDRKFAIVQIDLDNFKRVNDTLGHAAGDYLLKTLGSRLNFLASQISNFKPYRWGGDEFIALIERDVDVELEQICQELTDIIAIPVEYEETMLWPTVSLGVARFPEDASDRESLMIFSDLALYKTKELGRDGYQFFTSEMKEKVDTESLIERDLRTALEEDQFELFFQPQISSVDESITGVEALIRWNHPVKGMVAPNLFLDVVEHNGMARNVGCMVFDKAMKAVRSWIDEGLEFGRLAVNLSPQHLKKNTMLDDFFSSMEKYEVDSKYLAVEFLESFLLDDPHADIRGILEEFGRRGVHVELDDFGTGYASLSHLSTMPIDGIKIDRSFVQHISNNTKQQAIVEVVMSMSKLMQLRVVCEGIETYQQVKTVSQISNCSIQGYYVSKPMPYDQFTEWMLKERNKNILKAPKLKSNEQGELIMMTGNVIYS